MQNYQCRGNGYRPGCRAEGEADNCYRDIDKFAYHKNRIQYCLYYTFQVEKTMN